MCILLIFLLALPARFDMRSISGRPTIRSAARRAMLGGLVLTKLICMNKFAK